MYGLVGTSWMLTLDRVCVSIQIAGKNLRYCLGPSFCGSSNVPKQSTSHSSDATAKEENVISINQVLYSRHFQKNRVFANSHVLVQASKKGELISRVGASRVLRSIFPDVANQKRLPKRLINLIPIVQSMVMRFKACNIEELAEKLIPVPSEFKKFMSESPNVKRTVAERTAEPGRLSQSLIPAMVSKVLDDGYLSQNEAVMSSSGRKRKRREEAIETLSHASATSGTKAPDQTVNRQKKRRKGGDGGSDGASTNGGVENLTKLQQHKEEIKQLLAFTTPKRKIYRLVRKLVARIIPKDIWGVGGKKKNWKCVKQLLRKFVFSRKFDVFSLKKVSSTSHPFWRALY
ncbi:hypothetical protein BBJ28_00012192 [Nothophytophthora sp. Chile5]|nr:hypothetical protein BBJ28_00012192 [Nothophytophthora sp. Chile5]